MSEEKEESLSSETVQSPGENRSREAFPDLEELQREVERRIRDNRRFLERFMDDDFADGEAEEDEGEEFEEL